MVKLIRKNTKEMPKTTVWCVEEAEGQTKRKQFSLYGITIEEFEELLQKEFKAK